MDAMDLNWCLTCNRHIDSDGTAPYCSRECLTSDRPSSSQPHPPAYHARVPSYQDSLSELTDDHDWSYPEPSLHSRSTASSHRAHAHAHIQPSAWIGRGAAGIHAWASTVHPGAPSDTASIASASTSASSRRPPKLLLAHQRPVAPTLCMSKTIPAPAAARTPQHSLPSLVSAATSASATPASSVSPATPCSDAPRPPRQNAKSLMGALTAHLRHWAGAPAEPPRAAPAIPAEAPEPACVEGAEDDFLVLELDRKLGAHPLEPWQPGTLGVREKPARSCARPIEHAALGARGRRPARAA